MVGTCLNDLPFAASAAYLFVAGANRVRPFAAGLLVSAVARLAISGKSLLRDRFRTHVRGHDEACLANQLLDRLAACWANA